MEFWIIENGEKRGPFPDYTLREMIRDEKVTASTKVWHEGAEGWSEAREIGILRREFEKAEENSEPKLITPPPMPQRVDWGIMWRRLGARWLDVSLSMLLFVSVARVAGISLKVESGDEISGWVIIIQFVPALIFEGILTHLFAKTPGKWLMGLSVETREGGRLALGASVMRSMRVWVLGLGMAIGPLMLIGHLLALWMVRKNGAPLWDLMTGYRVKGGGISPLRIVLFFVALMLVWASIVGVMWPYIEPEWDASWNEAMERSLK